MPLLGELGASELSGGLTAFLDTFRELTNVINSFVGAFNPAAVEQFELAMRNVTATIGQALLPVTQVLTGALQDVAAILDGPMKALADPLRQLAALFGAALAPAAQTLGAALDILSPVIDLLTSAFSPLLDAVRINAAFIVAWGAVLKTAFGALKPVIDSVTTVLKDMLRGMVTFTAYLLKWVGANDVLNRLEAALRQQAEPGRVLNAAPQNLAIKGLEQITRDLALSSALAGQGEQPRTADQSLADIAAAVKAAREDNRDWKEVVLGWIKHDLPDAIVAAFRRLRHDLDDLGENAKQGMGIQEGGFGEFAFDVVTGRYTRRAVSDLLPRRR